MERWMLAGWSGWGGMWREAWSGWPAWELLTACAVIGALGLLLRLWDRRAGGRGGPEAGGAGAAPPGSTPVPEEKPSCRGSRQGVITMDNILSRLKQLTPDELREEIVKAGQKCGPITLTTRSIFEKRLAQSLWEEQGEASVSNGVPGTATADNGHLETNKPPVNQNGHVSSSEDVDFGYSMGLNPPEEEALMHKMGPGSTEFQIARSGFQTGTDALGILHGSAF